LELNSGQIEEFIKKWFKYVYSAGAGIGAKNADAMIGEIREHEAIEKLIVNPFMLTAVCILYHDRKELPSQRAELYKKFIDGLLYKRFKEDS
jgi:predicted NACHT family NTPase